MKPVLSMILLAFALVSCGLPTTSPPPPAHVVETPQGENLEEVNRDVDSAASEVSDSADSVSESVRDVRKSAEDSSQEVGALSSEIDRLVEQKEASEEELKALRSRFSWMEERFQVVVQSAQEAERQADTLKKSTRNLDARLDEANKVLAKEKMLKEEFRRSFQELKTDYDNLVKDREEKARAAAKAEVDKAETEGAKDVMRNILLIAGGVLTVGFVLWLAMRTSLFGILSK